MRLMFDLVRHSVVSIRVNSYDSCSSSLFMAILGQELTGHDHEEYMTLQRLH